MERRDFLKLLTISAAAGLANCAPEPLKRGIFGIAKIPRLQTPEPETTDTPDLNKLAKQIIESTNSRFLSVVNTFRNSENTFISNIPRRLYWLQENDNGKVYVSLPNFDKNGQLTQSNYPLLFFGFQKDTTFRILVNTNMYFRDKNFPDILMAASLDESLNYYDTIKTRNKDYIKSHPNINIYDALAANPDWVWRGSLHSWFLTTKNILAPMRKEIPTNYSVYQKLISIYDKSGDNEEVWNQVYLNASLGGSTS